MANKNIKDSIANIIPPKKTPVFDIQDESDDLEAAKRSEPTESEIMQAELEPIQEQVLKGPDAEIKDLARKQRGLQTD
jgi:hypothetical protein